jgi:hypothetical protein
MRAMKQSALYDLTLAYRMRWKRRRLLFRCWRKRRQLCLVQDNTHTIAKTDILGFICVRNEELRLPYTLQHYRALGVRHFFCVVNNSTDTTLPYLLDQPDCSVWVSDHSYKLSRFGMDWLGWLQLRYAHGHWAVTFDADELLIYPHWDQRPLGQLTAWLDRQNKKALGAPLLDLYPKGRLADTTYHPGQDPTQALPYYDAYNTTHILQNKHKNQWIQGGPRARVFFHKKPRRAPTLNKIPLVKWNRSYVYVTSTHIALPRFLNGVFDATDELPLIGCLLHTKFLPDIPARASEEMLRKQHFENSDLYNSYYQSLIDNPVLWNDESEKYTNWRDLVKTHILWKSEWGS